MPCIWPPSIYKSMPRIQNDDDPLEIDIEAYLDQRVRAHGGFTRKLAWSGVNGAPDRFIGLNQIYLVECKRRKRRPTQRQLQEHELLRSHSAIVLLIDTKEKVDYFIKHASKIRTKATPANWIKTLSQV